MDLRFQGDLTPWHGLLLALLAGVAAAAIYFREVRRQRGLLAKLLPLLRGLAVFLIMLMLIGPVLHLARVVPLEGRLLVFVDASKSMSVTDDAIEPLRKVRLMKAMGLLPAQAFKDDTSDTKAAAAARKLLAAKSKTTVAAVNQFDAMSRWQRVGEEMLAGSGSSEGLLRQIADRQGVGVDLFALTDKDSPRVWWSEQSAELSRSIPYKPEWPATDLSDGLQARTTAANGAEPAIAAVLISDGQHNTGPSPLDAAQSLGRRHIPVFVVGVGGTTPPPDLAVLSTEGPETVFIEDRAKGRILLRDTMPANQPFTLRITFAPPTSENDAASPAAGGEGRVVWEKSLTTTGGGLRKIDYDFPIGAAARTEVARLAAQGIEAMSLPLAFTVTAGPVESEKDKENNQTDLMVRAIKSRRKVLLMDGRPRWEYRYLRNLLERDHQWDANSLVAGVDRINGGWVRANAPGAFPRDKETLLGYDVVILGEVPLSLLQPVEVEWLRDFVNSRGGGLVFIDGRRGALPLYLGTPLGALLPIKWHGESSEPGPWRLRLTPAGQRSGALSLASDPGTNASLWQNLPGPHWIAPAVALPGSETLVEAVAGSHAVPAMVTRRFGAGRVWYTATDETWRWRDDVEDLYHQRYWNQVLDFLMEPPYAVRDQYVSLDVGALHYKTGESAQLRALVRDAAGRPVLHPTAQAVLYRDGHEAATVPLNADENGGGRLRGDTGPLEAGHYEMGLRVPGLSAAQTKARVAFVVQGGESGEMAVLTCNEELLRQMADSSGGQYFREEEAGGLVERLRMIPHTRTIENDIPLWNHWPWFGVIAGLLTVEWLLRKKLGMV